MRGRSKGYERIEWGSVANNAQHRLQEIDFSLLIAMMNCEGAPAWRTAPSWRCAPSRVAYSGGQLGISRAPILVSTGQTTHQRRR